mgnify:CR=1 FL=1
MGTPMGGPIRTVQAEQGPAIPRPEEGRPGWATPPSPAQDNDPALGAGVASVYALWAAWAAASPRPRRWCCRLSLNVAVW